MIITCSSLSFSEEKALYLRSKGGWLKLVKVLFVVHSLPTGGIERLLLEICRGAKEHGFAPHVCCLVEEGAGAHQFRELEVPIKVLAGKSSLAPWHIPRNLYVFKQLVDHIRKLQPTALQAEMFYAGTLGRLAAAYCSVPVIIHGYHNFYPWKGWLARYLDRQMAKISSNLVVPTKAVAHWTAKQLQIPEERFTHLANGICPPSDKEVNLNISMDEVVSFCGRFYEQKRPLLAADIFLHLAKERPQTSFLAIGDGPLLPAFKEKTRSLDERIEYVGRVDDPSPYFKVSDLLLLPSNREGFGLVPGEALLASCAVLLSSLPPLREVYGFLGDECFVNSHKPAIEWVSSAQKLLDSPARREEMLKAAEKRLRKIYSKEKMVAAYASLYKSSTTTSMSSS